MKAKSCLVLAAHPDDEVLGCGGTVARLSSQGAKVHIAFLADGIGARRSGADVAGDPELSARREAARAAGRILGAASVEFGDFPDNRMDSVALLDVVRAIEAHVDRHSPELVFSHHAGDVNVDHGVVHRATLAACRPQPGHPVRSLLYYEVPSSTEWQTPASGEAFAPNWFVDISAHLETKRRALEAYAMEMRAWPHPRSHKAIGHLAHWRGATIGAEAAEAFMLGRHIERSQPGT